MSNILKLSNDKTLLTIGDPHLGRRFVTNVPLEALGVREQQLKDKYVELLNTQEVDYICMMGDLFDKFSVPNEIILFAWQELEKAALANPETEYIFNRGNHDESRDANLKSAWNVFSELAAKAKLKNVTVVGDSWELIDDILALPWHPFQTPVQMSNNFLSFLDEQMTNYSPEVVLTHNDVSTYGSDGEHTNLMDFEGLKRITNVVLNGHVHQAGEIVHENGLKVINTGSMMPLNFAEDKTGGMYVTLTLEQFEKADLSQLEDKSVRVLLKPDEEAPDPIKCLQFKVKRVDEKGKDTIGEVKPEDFELKKLFDTSMADVKDPLKSEVWKAIKDNL